MAGIGFELKKIGREHGIGGLANAAVFGALFSSGPWLITAGAMLMLNRWAAANLTVEDQVGIQTILVYSFFISTLIAAPVAMLATRATADLIFAKDRAAISSVFLAATTTVTVLALVAGSIVFGAAVTLPIPQFAFALAVMILLAQIWVAGPFLTAVKRIMPIIAAYLLGSILIAAEIYGLKERGETWLLGAISVGLAATLLMICLVVHDEFPGPAGWPKRQNEAPFRVAVLGFSGLASAVALGIDKWILWFGPDSVRTIGSLRINPVNDQSSFLGLLTIVPGLTLVLVSTETHFHGVFKKLLAQCTGTSTYRNIEKGRQELAFSIIRDLRLLLVSQAVIAAFCWVLAPEILRLVGGDARGLFGFRFTAVGVVFHIAALHATVILSYYDLMPRVLIVWTVFALVSAAATLVSMNAGFASFGWGYMVGALAAAVVSLTLVAQATVRLTYLLFVGNNPATIRRSGEFG